MKVFTTKYSGKVAHEVRCRCQAIHNKYEILSILQICDLYTADFTEKALSK